MLMPLLRVKHVANSHSRLGPVVYRLFVETKRAQDREFKAAKVTSKGSVFKTKCQAQTSGTILQHIAQKKMKLFDDKESLTLHHLLFK